jgi:hypothetical protein
MILRSAVVIKENADLHYFSPAGDWTMPRIWFSFPRILGIRPRISFSLAELKGKPSRPRGGVVLLPPDNQKPQHDTPEWAQVVAWVVLGFAIWGFLAMVGCVVMIANAGTCRIYGEGTDTVEVCGDGRSDYSASVTDRHGHKRQYGEPNGGFERYPGQERPVYERRDERLQHDAIE